MAHQTLWTQALGTSTIPQQNTAIRHSETQ